MAIRIAISKVFSVVNVFFLSSFFYCRLPSNIYCIEIVLLFSLSSRVGKAQRISIYHIYVTIISQHSLILNQAVNI